MTAAVLTEPSISNIVSGIVAKATVINSLAIRDTNAHNATTDTPGTYTFVADLRQLPGSRMLYVNNGLNKNVDISLQGSIDGTTLVTVGSSVTVTTATQTFIDSYQLPQLSDILPYASVTITAADTPTTGTITVVILAGNGGGSINNVGTISLGTTTVTGSLPAGTNSIGKVTVLPVPTGLIAAAGGAPSATNAGTETTYTIASQANHFIVQNNTSINVKIALDATVTAGSFVLAPNTTWIADIQATAFHLLTASAQNINGTAANNIVIMAWQ